VRRWRKFIGSLRIRSAAPTRMTAFAQRQPALPAHRASRLDPVEALRAE
jgi:hypothetical protein